MKLVNWQTHTIDLSWLAAVLPALGVALLHRTPLLINLLLVILVLQGWHALFSMQRAASPSRMLQRLPINPLLQATIYVLLLPVDTSPVQLILAASFGAVFGELLFGGRGFSFLNPVVTGLSFHLFSTTQSLTDAAVSVVPVWLLIPTAIALLLLDLISIRTLAGLIAGMLLMLPFNGNLVPIAQALLASSPAALALLLLGCDPAAGGSSNAARWLHGLLLGAVLMILAGSATGQFSAVIFALLLASLSAPLIDHAVMALHIRRRRHRHARLHEKPFGRDRKAPRRRPA